MPAGIQVWGEGGQFVQIDSNYRSLRMTAHGSVTPNQFFASGDGNWFSATIQVTGAYPVVAFRSNSYTIAVTTYVGPETFNWTFLSQGPTPSPVEYWVFNERLPPALGNVGIQIFKDDGQTVVFDGNDKSAKIIDFFTYTGALLNVGQSIRRDYPGASWAVAPCQCTTLTSKSPTTQITLAYALSTIGSQFTLIGLRPYIGANTNMGAQASAVTNPSYLFVDVAGY